MKQSSSLWTASYNLLFALYAKYGNTKPSNDELKALLETIKSAMKKDVDNCNAVPDKLTAKALVDTFCKLTETILTQELLWI